jgi:two-component system nitrate/nitrite response regulator NarL
MTDMEPQQGVERIRVLLVDDNPTFRKTTRLILLTSEDIEVVGEADDGVQSLAEARRLRPDVVLMDCQMPRMDGAEATRRIRQENPGIRVVALTMGDDQEGLERMRDAGVQEVLLKGVGPEEISRAIRSATN